MREPDGLALSSRNVYLDPQQRQQARLLNQVLASTAREIESGVAPAAALAAGLDALNAGDFDRVEYFELRDGESLSPVDRVTRPARLLVAVQLGRTRLIDNWPVIGQ